MAVAPGAAAMSSQDIYQDPTEAWKICSGATGYQNCVGGNTGDCEVWITAQGLYFCGDYFDDDDDG